MADQFDVSVVISTCNRSDVLGRALESVLRQEPRGVRYEVLVVDNNSTDRTGEVIDSYVRQGHPNLRHLFEGRQGVSYGRNAGIAQAKAPIIAFTDDDVEVGPEWVAEIKDALDRHPEVDYVGGKALSKSPGEFPGWLTRAHWPPVALFDYGDARLYVNNDNPICLGTCNAAFRLEVFRKIAPFSPEFTRTQDHELQRRLWRVGGQGLYLPELVVSTDVPADRLTKRYHRAWHTRHGAFMAMMRDELIEVGSARLFDVPAHMYRQAAMDAARLLWLSLTFRRDAAFLPETRLRYFRGFFRERRREFLKASSHGTPHEVARFVRALLTRSSPKR